jgi:hypothetical protein
MRQKYVPYEMFSRGFYITSFVVFFLITGLCTSVCCGDETISQSGGFNPDPWVVLHSGDSDSVAASGSVISEKLESATLVLTRPDESERIAYTQRNFSQPIEASIAWWMARAFMDNTTEFRGYQRVSAEQKAMFDEEKQIFFNFIQDSLDTAENESILGSDLILFRGISPYVAGMVLNNSEYREAAFASTTYDPVVSLDIFGTSDAQGFHNLLVLERKAGEHALYINEFEREYLLPRESDWQVITSVEIDALTIEADFPLYNRTTCSDTFEDVRLIYITPILGGA